MLRARIPTALVVAAALAMPATALAQSAGDNQYQDPLAGTHSGSGKHHSASGSTGSSGSATPSTPAVSPATTTTGTQPSATASQPASSSGQLPRTGFELLVPIELGLAMLLAGVTLHRVIALRDRR